MNNQERAVEVLKNGGIVIFPTDTAFGIGCRIDNEKSVKKLFDIKKRPKNKPMLALVDSVDLAQEYLETINPDVLKLMQEHWPGALTIIYSCKREKVPEIVRAGGDSLAVRMPEHKIRDIVGKVGVPILAPSANLLGGITPYTLEEVSQYIKTRVDFILTGKCKMNKVSTIVDCTIRPFKIKRQGAMDIKI